jgi:probable F420-dependent oxidoreductase
MAERSRPIEFGVHATNTDYSMPVVELAQHTEAAGLRSLWFAEHTHIPVGSDRLPGGDPMPRQYKHLLDPFIGAAFVAATTSLEVGTGVSVIAEHDPIALAKAVATLDHLSAGRVLLGVGWGYNRQEAENHGLPVNRRALVVEETVLLMREVWTQEIASFSGAYRNLSPSWSWPKPHRAGGPPVLLGAPLTDRNIGRIVRWADGWIPQDFDSLLNPTFVGELGRLRVEWERAGRDLDALQVVCFFKPTSVESMVRQAEFAQDQGVQRVLVFLEDRVRDEVMPILDRLHEVQTLLMGSPSGALITDATSPK